MKKMYSVDIPSPVPYYYNITSRGIRGLVYRWEDLYIPLARWKHSHDWPTSNKYSGDHDLSINFIGTQAWIRSLNFSITSEWRSWRVDGQVAGFELELKLMLAYIWSLIYKTNMMEFCENYCRYTRSYAPQLTFATVKVSFPTISSLVYIITSFPLVLCKVSYAYLSHVLQGAGHMAPAYKPKECKVMLERWISGENLWLCLNGLQLLLMNRRFLILRPRIWGERSGIGEERGQEMRGDLGDVR